MTKLSKKKVNEAIKGSGGILTTVANKCGVERISIYRFIDKYPEFRDLLEQEREKIIDVAENKLYAASSNGKRWAIERIIKGIGKNRGHHEKITQEVELKGGLDIDFPRVEIKVNYDKSGTEPDNQAGTSTTEAT